MHAYIHCEYLVLPISFYVSHFQHILWFDSQAQWRINSTNFSTFSFLCVGHQRLAGQTHVAQSTISRYSCRICVDRQPPYTARIYAAGFDHNNHIFLGVSTRYPCILKSVDRKICMVKVNKVVVFGAGFSLRKAGQSRL